METPLLHSLRGLAQTLSQGAKRNGRAQYGVEGWFPYYAGFPEQFVENVISGSRLQKGAVILDPWNGSGTTTSVASKLGYAAYGFDINPVAALVASAKLAHHQDATHTAGLIKRLSELVLRECPRTLEAHEPLLAWLDRRTAAAYRTAERFVCVELATPLHGETVNAVSGKLPPLAAFLLLALMRAAKRIISPRVSTNPTWVRPHEVRETSPEQLLAVWLVEVNRMAEALERRAYSSQSCVHVATGDSRNIPLDASTVDLVITSPPYCTRIDYIVSTSFEVAAMGVAKTESEFRRLRLSSMGAPLVRPQASYGDISDWPDAVTSILQTIKTHPSKASSGYYYKTYLQYFSDLNLSISQIARCLKCGGGAVFVVQNSYYKEAEVDLALTLTKIASSYGMASVFVQDVASPWGLAQINSRARKHQPAPKYRESIICLEKL
ncbi:MAG: DNA methyltransferase [Janthinobacterium lividum]